MLRFKERYQKEVVPQMMKAFGYKSPWAVPRLEKVLINTGFGRQAVILGSDEQKKLQQALLEDLALITGQRPVLTLAKKSIASFKLREGLPIGVKVTLRGQKMADFVDKFLQITLARTRDFRGISLDSLDKKGNLTLGIKEQIFFPEILPEAVKKIFGLEITFVVRSGKREESLAALKALGFPFQAPKQKE